MFGKQLANENGMYLWLKGQRQHLFITVTNNKTELMACRWYRFYNLKYYTQNFFVENEELLIQFN